MVIQINTLNIAVNNSLNNYAETPTMAARKGSRRIRLLWIGFATYLLILLNDFRYVRSVPLYVLALGLLINGVIVSVFVYELRKAYKKVGNVSGRPKS